MKIHTTLATAQDVFVDAGGMFGAGFNRRVSGWTYNECFRYDAERFSRELQGGWQSADKLIAEGKIYYIHNFHRSHGNCSEGFALQYGSKWACNTCGNIGVDKPWWAIKVTKDGNAWMCAGEGFSNLQDSENFAFGDTRDQAIVNYGNLMTTKKIAAIASQKGSIMSTPNLLLDIIQAVPDIGDKNAREITIARMAFAAGQNNTKDTKRLDWWIRKSPGICTINDNLICIAWLDGEVVLSVEGATVRKAIDAAIASPQGGV